MAGLLLAGCTSPQADAVRVDSILGYTLSNGEWITFESILFENGEVVAVGTSEDLESREPEAEVVDGG
ncbi:MAG: amidohydrolase, partial [Bacteroidetes bacterium]|nr:amidohydrolase [Bacteroidota bacterium]